MPVTNEEILFYTAPTDDVFEAIKANAIAIWWGYDNTFGYVSRKVSEVESIKNESSGWMQIVGMFDRSNQAILLSRLATPIAGLIILAQM